MPRVVLAMVLVCLAAPAWSAPSVRVAKDAMPHIESSERFGERLRVVLRAPKGGFTEANLEAISRALIDAHGGAGLRTFELVTRDPRGRLVPASTLVPLAPRIVRRRAPRRYTRPFIRRLRVPQGSRASGVLRSPPVDAPGQTQGFLTGKTVYLSAGHGWTWRSTNDYWGTQRGNTWDVVEDLVSAETVNQYLVNYLQNAGAQVFTVRERDLQTQMVIVDDGAPGYTETGPTFRTSTQPGFGGAPPPYTGAVNPMRAGQNRVFDATSAPTSTARWVPTIPNAGDYVVYVSYSAFSDRAPDAHYVVKHPGGQTHFRVDQRRHGQTWVALGRFYFEAGASPERGAVELHSDSERPGAILSADAVRFGGGMGDIVRGARVSGKPRYEEAARYYAQFSGASANVYDNSSDDGSDDVGTRSRLAAWLHEPGEDALYLAWHTNAPRPGRGTSTYVYGPNAPDGTYNFTGTAGSDRLARLVHDELVADIRAAYDATWRNRGVYSAYFGEVNPRHNDEMPAALVEVAFHDTELDAAALKEPRFRRIAARAMYQGIAKYFAERASTPVKLLPEPPTHLVVQGDGPTRVRVRWRAPGSEPGAGDAATGYRVYRSRDGRAWDDGAAATGTEHVFDHLTDGQITVGQTVFVRVTSTNAGGESFPTATLAARTRAAGTASLLFVHAFDRLDASMVPRVVTPLLGTPYRMLLDRMNRYDASLAHARAAERAGLSFDSAHAHAVGAEDVALAPYRAVVWMAGEESAADESVSTSEQAALRAFAASGGALFTSGSELAWELATRGNGDDATFLREVLRTEYAADDSDVTRLTGVGAFEGLPELRIDDGTLGAYDVDYPDVLRPGQGATAALLYTGTQNVAAIAAPGAVVHVGAPFEALFPEAARDAFFARAMELLGVDERAATDGGADGGVDGGGASDGGVQDAGRSDAGAREDGGAADGGVVAKPSGGCGCGSAPGGGALTWLLCCVALLGAVLRRRASRGERTESRRRPRG